MYGALGNMDMPERMRVAGAHALESRAVRTNSMRDVYQGRVNNGDLLLLREV